MDDVDAGLDVGEGVGGGEDGLALELLVQVPVGSPVQGEGRAVDKAAQVVVLIEVGDAVLHLVRVEVRLHVRDLDARLHKQQWTRFSVVFSDRRRTPRRFAAKTSTGGNIQPAQH